MRYPLVVLTMATTLLLTIAGPPMAPPMQEWPVYGADQAGTHYWPVTGLDRSTVARLEVAWEWKPGETPLPAFGTRPGAFENTPLMIDNVLYVSTMYNRVAALDAETGAPLWVYDPKAYEDGQPPNGTGFVHRGVAAWRDNGKLRIFMNSRARLICLDALTGQPVQSFGDHGMIDLTKGLRWAVDPKRYTNTSPPVVYKNLVILGNGVGDRMTYRQDPPGDVRAFDARTGRQIWIFHTVPGAGEFGNETWGDESWKFTGHTNVWAPMTLDEARGLVYLPVSTPSNDFYGVRRPGANLFGDSIVCLDAATGVRKWHFQIAHHGLWDYDPASAPNLVSITVNGRHLDAVVQLTKQGFVFVFDRVTGKPVWPIEERPVPPSDVVGEHASPTQPFPTRPVPIASQGVTADDVFDLTPALKAAAAAELRKYRTGPLYTPPSVQGTFQQPGVIGGANWGGGAFDPESGVLYVKTSNLPAIARIVAADHSAANPRASEVDADFIGELGGNADFLPPVVAGSADAGAPVAPMAPPAGRGAGRGAQLPIVKPPYGEVVAINLNTGDVVWRVPFGDTASIRSHPALAGVVLPARLGVSGAPGILVTKGGLIFGGGGDSALYALDTTTGEEVWHAALPRRTSGTPMAYRAKSGRQFIVIATGSGTNTALVAFALK
jgi:quinoprotein glucose dehydrogenase